jgi:hypothetical protein
MLDEQSFQGLLSAAFTIQEHNDRRKQDQPTPPEPEIHLEPERNGVCPHCGVPKAIEESTCGSCGQDEFRPGERLQRNWASMWLMSQEQVLWPEGSPELHANAQNELPRTEPRHEPRDLMAHDFAASGILALPVGSEVSALATLQDDWKAHARERKDEVGETLVTEGNFDLPGHPSDLSANHDSVADAIVLRTNALNQAKTETAVEAVDEIHDDVTHDVTDDQADYVTDQQARDTKALVPSSLPGRFAEMRIVLRFHRADLYLGLAVLVASIALLWPVASSPRHAALSPWQKALVSLGIAEASAPTIHLQGDPGVEVWIDSHTALYYCPGEEQYGKTAGGHFSSQRDAQMDRFEPASRSACE